jgi:integrase
MRSSAKLTAFGGDVVNHEPADDDRDDGAVPDIGTDLVAVAVLPERVDRGVSPARVYIMSLAPSSRRTQWSALRTVANLIDATYGDPDTFPWWCLTYGMTQAVRSELAARYAPATANRLISCVRSVLRESWRLGLMTAEEFHRAADIRNVGGSRLPAGRAVEEDEIGALLRVCEADQRVIGRRDAAVIATLTATGVRRAELASASLQDLSPDQGGLTVLGKGNREREVFLNADARRYLGAWLDVRGHEPGPLFTAVNKAGKIRPVGHLAPSTVRDIVIRRGVEAGVTDFSAHSFRRQWAGRMLDITDQLTVERLGGWKPGSGVIGRYDRRPAERGRAAVERLRLPA